MPVYYPQNFKIFLAENHEQEEDIKANYNLLFNKKEKSLKQKYQKDFTKIIRRNRSHATLLSDFLKPFISDKNDPKYEELKNITLLLLDPLYSENIKGLKTFDAIIGYQTDNKIKKLFLIEAKSSKVDDEYKNYDEYNSEKIKDLLIKRIKEKYPRLVIDSEDFEIIIFLLIFEKHQGSWKTSLDRTKKDVFLWSRTGKDPIVKFNLIWKKNEEMYESIEIIKKFFLENEILKTTEFEMSFSLDSMYNLDVLRKNYINKYQNDPINFELCRFFFKKIARSDYFEKGNSEENFYKKLIKIGLDYDAIHKKDLKSDLLYFREGENVLKEKFVEKQLNENLYSNEETKTKLLSESIEL